MKKSEKEIRAFNFEVRAEENDEHGTFLTGQPIVYNEPTDMGWYEEVIDDGALDEADMRDVRFLVNHNTDMIPLARSRNNNANSTMQMEVVPMSGMRIRVDLDVENNTEAKNLYSAVKRGDISGMSFMFSVDKDTWEGLDTDYPKRHIQKFSKIFEVSAVTFPAYEATSIQASKEQPMMKDCIEGKVFGIGLESFTVGSHDFYTAYAAKYDKILTIDTGHYHPTESPADKVSAVLPFVKELMLHVSRPVRWDSDHVTIMDDPTQELFFEIVRAGALDRVHYGLDFFDGSINRIGAYVIGSRSAQKCMLRALLEPKDLISKYELAGEGYKVLALIEEQKAMPWQAVYDMFCLKNGVAVGDAFIAEIDKYVADVTSKR